MSRLCNEQLAGRLREAGLGARLRILDSVDSTNRELWRWLDAEEPAADGCASGEPERIVLADHQTGGYGRHGRHWHSPAGVNLYISAHFLLPSALDAPIVVLSTAFSLRQSLAALVPARGQPQPMLKWPNDVLISQKKVSGILVERRLLRPDLASVVVGVGVNVNMLAGQAGRVGIDRPWTSLREEYGSSFDRTDLAARAISHWPAALDELCQTGIGRTLLGWGEYDALKGRTLEVVSADDDGKEGSRGLYLGIDSIGRLRLRGEGGAVMSFQTGEASIRD